MPDPNGGPITDDEIREYERAESDVLTQGLKALDPSQLSNLPIGPENQSVVGQPAETSTSAPAPADTGPSGGGSGGGSPLGSYDPGDDAETCGEEDTPSEAAGN